MSCSPSPVKAASQPEADVLASMETGSDQSLDTEDVFETKPSSLAASTGMPGSQGNNKSRRMVENMKVFDFDVDGEEEEMGDTSGVKSAKKTVLNLDKTVPKPVASNRRYTTMRDIGVKRKTALGSKGGRVAKKSKERAEGGGRVTVERAEKRGGGEEGVASDIGIGPGIVGSTKEDKRVKLCDERKKEMDKVGEERSTASYSDRELLPSQGSASLESSYTHTSLPGSNIRLAEPDSNVRLAEKKEEADSKKEVSVVSVVVLEAGSSRVNSGANGSDSRKSGIAASDEKEDPPTSYQDKHSQKASSSASRTATVPSSNVRHSEKKATSEIKPGSSQEDLSPKSDSSRPKSRVPSCNVRNTDKKVDAVAKDPPLPGSVHGFSLEEKDERVNGAWSEAGPSKAKIGKRKRAWLVQQDEKKGANDSDPYAFDISDGSQSAEKPISGASLVPVLSAQSESGSGSHTIARNAESSGIARTIRPDCSQQRKAVSRKKSVELDSDMLREIDAMLEGYEEKKKEEEEDLASRLSPSNSATVMDPRVGRLKKWSSDSGRGKSRRYAYTTRQVPSPSEGGGVVPRMKKAQSWPRRPRKELAQEKVRKQPQKQYYIIFVWQILFFSAIFHDLSK